MQKIKIKPFQETLNAGVCGPACLKMVLQYYGISKSEKELVKLCKATKSLGVDDKTIKKVAESFGLRVVIKNNSNFAEIEKQLEKKVPVIVDWFSRGRKEQGNSAVADGHYSVVAGLDDEYIFLQDPEIGKIRKMKRTDFMQVWFDFRGEFIKANELIIRQVIIIEK